MYYDDLTHRGLNHLINSPEPARLSTAKSLWDDTAQTARDLADVIESRLDRLTSTDGGWTGSGAAAFKQAVKAELIDNLRAYALQAGGHHKQGTQSTGYDTQVKAVLEAVNASHTTAHHNSVPWDVDPQWQADMPPKPDPDDKPKPGEPAKPDEPVKIRNGSGGVVKEVDKKHWESLLASTPASAPAYNGPLKVSVSGQVHQADQLFEAVDLDTTAKAAARQAASQVVAALDHFAPKPVPAAKTSGTDYAGNTGGGGGADPRPGGPGRTPGHTPGHTPEDDYPGHTPGPTPGLVPGQTPGTPVDPGPVDPYDPTQPPSYEGSTPSLAGTAPTVGGTPSAGDYGTGNGFGGIQSGTSAAGLGGAGAGVVGGVLGAGGVGTAGVGAGGVGAGGVGAGGVGAGGVGAGGVGAGAGAGAGAGGGMVGVGAPGAAGLGSFGGGASGAGASFAPGGPGGRGLVSAGNVGSIGGAGGTSGTGAGGAGGTGSGSGAGGGIAPVNRRRTDPEDSDEQSELDGTWLEEDDSVWGNRAGAPPAEIR